MEVDRNSRQARDRYLAAEAALWSHHGLAPTSHTLTVGRSRSALRVQEVGVGDPILFVHGTGGSGAYFAPLVAELAGFRCLVIDRPGWAMSEPIDYSGRPYGVIVSEVLRDTLDALEVERAHVVGASIGDLWVLRFAMAEPSRVERIVLLGGGPISPEITVPPFIKLLRSPVGNIIVRVPERPGMFRKQLASMGHSVSIEAGRIPEAFVDWHGALTRFTSWSRHERDMVRSIVGRRGFVPGLVPSEAEIAALEAPILMVYGTADPVASTGPWERFVAGMANGKLELIDDGGHLVWLDEPAVVGKTVQAFLE
jgi:pimeloyl-ACP methyl ester carboxylesterase